MKEVEQSNTYDEVGGFASNKPFGKMFIKIVLTAVRIFIIAILLFGVMYVFGWAGIWLSLWLCIKFLFILPGIVLLLAIKDKITKRVQPSLLRNFLFEVFLICGVYWVIAQLMIFKLMNM
jgi:hypothetical protein